ncbi:MAG: hypothetical protein IJX54_01515 [Oscillospiraceae bacterium]|nr:hypothetical protein [Oscillospiraceae bacterium]
MDGTTTTIANMSLDAITTALGKVMEWVKVVVDGLVGTDGALSELLPLFLVGVAISALLLGVKIIRSFIWGA